MVNYDPDKHDRRSIRLQGYDYSQPGVYFITICTQGRACLFGEIAEGEMRLDEAGKVVERWWKELAIKFPSVEVDDFVVMPNHFHGIVSVVGADLRVCPGEVVPSNGGAHIGAPLPKIVQWFKTMTTNEYIRGVKRSGWMPFAGRLWQGNYYEHIIRNEGDLHRIRQYIVDNPAKWAEDPDNPRNTETNHA